MPFIPNAPYQPVDCEALSGLGDVPNLTEIEIDTSEFTDNKPEIHRFKIVQADAWPRDISTLFVERKDGSLVDDANLEDFLVTISDGKTSQKIAADEINAGRVYSGDWVITDIEKQTARTMFTLIPWMAEPVCSKGESQI